MMIILTMMMMMILTMMMMMNVMMMTMMLMMKTSMMMMNVNDEDIDDSDECYDENIDDSDDNELPSGKHVEVLEEAILHDTLGTTAMSDGNSIIATE